MNQHQPVRFGCTGHQRLTDETASLVRHELDMLLDTVPSFVGISSLAEGADQIFAQTVIDNGGTLEAIIPSVDYESTFANAEDLQRYERLKSVASAVIQLEFDQSSEEAFWAAGQKVVQSSDVLIAVWDGAASLGLGGTGDVVRFAKELGKDVRIIWPAGSARKT